MTVTAALPTYPPLAPLPPPQSFAITMMLIRIIVPFYSYSPFSSYDARSPEYRVKSVSPSAIFTHLAAEEHTASESYSPSQEEASDSPIHPRANGMADTGANGVPVTAARALSPQSPAGASTPKASTASLPIAMQNGTPAAGLGGAPLEAGIEDLKVRSPEGADVAAAAPSFAQAMDIDQLPPAVGGPSALSAQNGHTQHPQRAQSSSTESSSTDTDHHPIPPSHLGSMYGSEGFLAQFADGAGGTNGFGMMPGVIGADGPTTSPERMMMTPEAAAAVSAADEIIKQMNGTSSVITGQQLGGPSGLDNTGGYQLPRGLAASSSFTKPREPRQPPDYASHRQSSTSSTATEASTSSEESDLCIPTLEWVTRPDAAASSAAAGAGWGFQPYLPSAAPAPQKGNGVRGSPARMPPPTSTGRSPRRTSSSLAGGPAQLGAGGSSHAPTATGLRNSSALPAGIAADLAADDDDDSATIGHGRDRSPSSSSQSAHSNLDVLSRAASLRGVPREPANPSAAPSDSKGKRKAGADAVAQWREGGIPTGYEAAATASGSKAVRTPYDENAYPRHGDPHGETPKKRRRSEINNEVIDPSLRDMLGDDAVMDDDDAANGGQFGEGGSPEEEADRSADYDDGSDGDAASDEGGDDSEYGAGSGGKAKRGGKTGKGAGAGALGKGKPRGRVSGASASAGSGAAAGAGAAAGQKKRKGEVSPSGAIKGGRKSSGTAAPGGGVQCDYVNPLPPYNRCQDVFTRKYDLPRHMARHARREGELVFEGKLQESKALLWATIKDKPKVSCELCGESFTRMDALKRHQAKQHPKAPLSKQAAGDKKAS